MPTVKPTLNQADINLLKKTFITKDDAKNFLTKDDAKNFATKDDLEHLATKELVIDASETILKGVQRMFDDQNKRHGKRFQTLETKINNVEKHIDDDINSLKADLSTTVSRREFNQLKTKIDEYHPAS